MAELMHLVVDNYNELVDSTKGKHYFHKYKPAHHLTPQILATDPMVDSWLLMSSPWPIATILAAYLYFVLSFGPKYMANKKPFQLKEVLVAYNFIQVIFSVFLVYLVSEMLLLGEIKWGPPHMFKNTHVRGCHIDLVHIYCVLRCFHFLR
jgi:hypothetical protein